LLSCEHVLTFNLQFFHGAGCKTPLQGHFRADFLLPDASKVLSEGLFEQKALPLFLVPEATHGICTANQQSHRS
jgi:hypothetical protein